MADIRWLLIHKWFHKSQYFFNALIVCHDGQYRFIPSSAFPTSDQNYKTNHTSYIQNEMFPMWPKNRITLQKFSITTKFFWYPSQRTFFDTNKGKCTYFTVILAPPSNILKKQIIVQISCTSPINKGIKKNRSL